MKNKNIAPTESVAYILVIHYILSKKEFRQERNQRKKNLGKREISEKTNATIHYLMHGPSFVSIGQLHDEVILLQLKRILSADPLVDSFLCVKGLLFSKT